jgi:hypothetical protein
VVLCVQVCVVFDTSSGRLSYGVEGSPLVDTGVNLSVWEPAFACVCMGQVGDSVEYLSMTMDPTPSPSAWERESVDSDGERRNDDLVARLTPPSCGPSDELVAFFRAIVTVLGEVLDRHQVRADVCVCARSCVCGHAWYPACS